MPFALQRNVNELDTYVWPAARRQTSAKTANARADGEDSTQSTATLHAFHPPDVIAGRFRIVRYVDRGGMGEIYEAEDLAIRSKPHVALKIIRRRKWLDTGMAVRFEREAEISKMVTHPNICRVHDLGFHRSQDASGSPVEVPFLTMEFLNGCTLAARLRGHGPLEPSEAFPIIRQIAAALDTVHGAGIVHGDLKPANIMLVPVEHQVSPRTVISDFGLARRLEATRDYAHDTELTGGTPDYMSPEQVIGGGLSTRSDIYSFGLVIYRMLTGRLPFSGDKVGLRMASRLSENPASPRKYAPQLDPRWEAVIMKCLAIDPDLRFGSAHQIVSSLAPARSRLDRPDGADGRPPGRPAVLGPLLAGAAGSLLAISVWKLLTANMTDKRIDAFEKCGRV